MKSKNWKILNIAFSIALVACMAKLPVINAHLPETVVPYYDHDTSILTVDITHSVTDNTTHYIFRVEIYVNDTLADTHDYTGQPTKSGFSYEYPMSLTNGTSIEVVAYCNLSGDNRGNMVVGVNGDPAGDEPNSVPFAAGPVAIFSIFGIIGLFWKIKSRRA